MIYQFVMSRRQFVACLKATASMMAPRFRKCSSTPLPQRTKRYIGRAFIRLTDHDPAKDGSWGIASTWQCIRQTDGSYIATLHGPRLSLADWCPRPLLDAAHDAWLDRRTVEYASQRWDVSPSASGLGETHRLEETWPSHDAEFPVQLPVPGRGLSIDSHEDGRRRLYRRLKVVVTMSGQNPAKIVDAVVTIDHAKQAFDCPSGLRAAMAKLGVTSKDTVKASDVLSLDMFGDKEIIATVFAAVTASNETPFWGHM